MSEQDTRNNVADEKNDIRKNVLNKIKETSENAVQWVKDTTPVALEKASEIAEKAKDVAEDAAILAGSGVKKAKVWIETQQDANKLRKKEYDLRTLRPIFDKDIPTNYEHYPLLNIVKSDDKRMSNPFCLNSFGFMSESRDLDVLNIYLSSFSKFNITLNGATEEGVYFANPYVPGEYIDSNQYAIYLKDERVRELFNIADCLGAKYVSVSFKMVEKKTDEEKGKLKLKNGKNKAEIEAERKLSESLQLSIDHTSHFKPHNTPTIPKLVYYKDNNTIKDLIERRMQNKLVSDTYSISYASASSAKMKEASKVDSAIKALKLSASQSLSVCYKVENQIRMSYRIEFED